MLIVAVVYIPVVHTFIYLYRVCIYCAYTYALALAYQSLQLNLHETDLLFRYLSHHLTWHCSSIEDLHRFARFGSLVEFSSKKVRSMYT